MPGLRHESDDSARPFLLLGGAILLVVSLLSLSRGETPPPGARPDAPGGSAAPLVPGAPVDGVVNSPVPDGPAVTIVEDVRETLKRLPLDRNHPKGWSNPVPRPK